MSNKQNAWAIAMEKTVRAIIKKNKGDTPDIGVIISVYPLTINYKGVNFTSTTDIIYCNSLLLEPNVVLPIETIVDPQNFGAVTPPLHNTPVTTVNAFTATINGTIPDFIKAGYDWWKAWHDRFILHAGDYVICQRIGAKKILVMNKVNKIGENNE